MAKKPKPPNAIGGGEKAAFMFGNMGSSPFQMLTRNFLLIFYTDVVGLHPASIATLFLITRILDAVNDPIMGYVIDHVPRTKLGRFRGSLLVGGIICSLNYLLVWFGPLWAPAGKIMIAYISYILLGVTHDLMDIPLQSLIPVMTSDEKERNVLAVLKSLATLATGATLAVGVPLFIDSRGDAGSAYSIVVFAAVVFTFVCTVTAALGVRERVQPIADETYKLRDIFGIITIGPVLATFLTNLFYGVADAIVNTSNVFYFTYILDNRFDIMGFMNIVAAPGTFLAIFLSGYLVSKFGKKPVYVLAAFVMGGGLLLRLINVTYVPLLLLTNAIIGVGLGLQTVLSSTINADNIDYVEHARGQRAEGGITSLTSFINKSGGALGGAISGYVLALTGYVANTAQTETARMGILANTIVIPAVLFMLAGLIFWVGYKINNEKLGQIAADLQERRLAKGEEYHETPAR